MAVNNKKTTEWIAAIGLQLPKQAKLLQLLNNNVSQKPSIVNNNSMQNSGKNSNSKQYSVSATLEKNETETANRNQQSRYEQLIEKYRSIWRKTDCKNLQRI